jgi:hypothetical protein
VKNFLFISSVCKVFLLSLSRSFRHCLFSFSYFLPLFLFILISFLLLVCVCVCVYHALDACDPDIADFVIGNVQLVVAGFVDQQKPLGLLESLARKLRHVSQPHRRRRHFALLLKQLQNARLLLDVDLQLKPNTSEPAGRKKRPRNEKKKKKNNKQKGWKVLFFDFAKKMVGISYDCRLLISTPPPGLASLLHGFFSSYFLFSFSFFFFLFLKNQLLCWG